MGSSMTLGSKGSRPNPKAHRLKMPWTASTEKVPHRVLLRRDNAILDGSKIIGAEDIDRMSQLDPLDVLKATVAQHKYYTSTGSTLFQLAAQADGEGRGQIFYRREWKEGTYDKHITLAAVEFSRDGQGSEAYGYVTFHGESTLRPTPIKHAEVPGWVMEFDKSRVVPPDQAVPPPPSIGTEIPVDPKKYKLKSYPFYDPPNPPEFVERLLKDRGVLPDPPIDRASEQQQAEGQHLGADSSDGSVLHTA